MNTYDAIRSSVAAAHQVLQAYVADLEDRDLLVRPVPGANHIAWQLGHLIVSEQGMLNALRPGRAPELPPGFAEKYTRETASLDEAHHFVGRARYLELYETQRRALMEQLETYSEGDLDRPAPESMRRYAPTIASAFIMAGVHELMHAGQFTVVRRALNKAVLF